MFGRLSSVRVAGWKYVQFSRVAYKKVQQISSNTHALPRRARPSSRYTCDDDDVILHTVSVCAFVCLFVLFAVVLLYVVVVDWFAIFGLLRPLSKVSISVAVNYFH